MAEVTVKLTDSEIAHLLCSARESSCGSGYWAEFQGCPYTYDSKDLTPLLLPVTILDLEENGKEMVLDRAALDRGQNALGKGHHNTLAEILGHNGDASTGDNFLQLCLFGELVYG